MRGPDKAGPSRRNRNARPGKPPFLSLHPPAGTRPTPSRYQGKHGHFSRFPSSGHAWPDPFCPCFGEGGRRSPMASSPGGGKASAPLTGPPYRFERFTFFCSFSEVPHPQGRAEARPLCPPRGGPRFVAAAEEARARGVHLGGREGSLHEGENGDKQWKMPVFSVIAKVCGGWISERERDCYPKIRPKRP